MMRNEYVSNSFREIRARRTSHLGGAQTPHTRAILRFREPEPSSAPTPKDNPEEGSLTGAEPKFRSIHVEFSDPEPGAEAAELK